MNSKRKLFRATLMIAMLGLLVGCGSNQPQPEPQPSGGDEQQSGGETVNKYTLTYKAGDGTGSDYLDQNIDEGTSRPLVTFAVAGFTAPEGKRFLAWSVDGAQKQPGESIVVNANKTITAVYEVIPPTLHTVTYQANGGVGDNHVVENIVEGSEHTLITLTEAGFTAQAHKLFDGWLIGEETKQPGEKITVNEDKVVLAKWADEPYQLALNAESQIASLASFTAQTTYGLEVTIETTEASENTQGVCTLAAGGTLLAKTAIPGIVSIDVETSAGEVSILSAVYATDEFAAYTAGKAANYFKLVAGSEGASIASLVVKYANEKASKFETSSQLISENEGVITLDCKANTAQASWDYRDWDKIAMKEEFGGKLSGNFVLEFDVESCIADSNNHQFRFGPVFRRADGHLCDRFSMTNCYWNDVNEVCGIEYRDFDDESGYGLGGNCESATAMVDKYLTQVLVSRVGESQEPSGSIAPDANVVGHHKIVRVIDNNRTIFTWLLKASGSENYVNVMQWAVDHQGEGRPYYRATNRSIYSEYVGDYGLEFASEGVFARVSGIKVSEFAGAKFRQTHVGDERMVIDGEKLKFNWKGNPEIGGWGINDHATFTLNEEYGHGDGNFTVEFDVTAADVAYNGQNNRVSMSLIREGQADPYVYERFSMSNAYWNDSNEVFGIEYRSLPTGVGVAGDGNGGFNQYDGKTYVSRVGTAQESTGSITPNANVLGHHKIVRTVGASGSTFEWTFKAVGAENYINVMDWAVAQGRETSTALESTWTGNYTICFQATGINAVIENVYVH